MKIVRRQLQLTRRQRLLTRCQRLLTRHQRLALSFLMAGVVGISLLLSALPHSVQASSKQSRAAGATVFSDKGCQHCHGMDATGTDRGPDLSTVGKKWHKDRIEQQIREGGDGMPAFGNVLQPDEIKSLVDFLSAKHKPAPKAKAAVPVPAPAKSSNDDSGC